MKTKKVIAENEGEFSTEQVFIAGGKYFYIEENGGSRGAHNRMCGDGRWRDYPVVPAHEISLAEALAYAAEWGYDDVDIDD